MLLGARAVRLSRRQVLGSGLSLAVLGVPTGLQAAPRGSLLAYVRGLRELDGRTRKTLLREVRIRFGGAALDPETVKRPEVGVAKSILATALFMGIKPRAAAQGAWNGWRSALAGVPPPIAYHYEILVFEGRKPRGRPIDLALTFPEHFNEEIAPDLVAWWQRTLDEGRLPDGSVEETRQALARTRVLMRPLLIDRLRLLAQLDRSQRAARGLRTAELARDRKALEGELVRSLQRVSRRPEVLDDKGRPYDRLLLALDDFGMAPSEEDRLLDPDGPPPPPRPVPNPNGPPPPPRTDGGLPLVEPEGPPPLEHLPAQPRAGDPGPWRDPVPYRALRELARGYRTRLERTIKVWMGTPYRWGNDTPGVGTDCSGFTRAVFRTAFAVDLPRTSRDQFRSGRSVSKRGLRAGDLVFFDTKDRGGINHVGIFLGDGRFVHASWSQGVVIDGLNNRSFRRAYRGARRVLAYPE